MSVDKIADKPMPEDIVTPFNFKFRQHRFGDEYMTALAEAARSYEPDGKFSLVYDENGWRYVSSSTAPFKGVSSDRDPSVVLLETIERQVQQEATSVTCVAGDAVIVATGRDAGRYRKGDAA